MIEQNDRNLELALWRYSIISPLLGRNANGLHFGEMLDLASWNKYVHPNGSHVALSAETIRKWLYLYLHRGPPGLVVKTRSDRRLKPKPNLTEGGHP
jgi:putative transposase